MGLGPDYDERDLIYEEIESNARGSGASRTVVAALVLLIKEIRGLREQMRGV